jgi:putative DeoR family transcriptional regulator (stage III sporulation protein D)
MRDYIVLRVLDVARHIIDTHDTIRDTATAMKLRKSTVHKDLLYRLPLINPIKFRQVRAVIRIHISDRANKAIEARWRNRHDQGHAK